MNPQVKQTLVIGRSESFTGELKIPGIYGMSSKGSKCYEVQARFSPWLEGSWERSFELATVLTVPRRDNPARYSNTSRDPGLGGTEVTGRELCMVSFDWSIVYVDGGNVRENWSQILKSLECQGGSLAFINETVRFHSWHYYENHD